MSMCHRSPGLGGGVSGWVFLSAARKEAISPGSRVGLRSKSCIEMVGLDVTAMALCNLGLLRKPMLFKRRSFVNLICEAVWDGMLCNGVDGTVFSGG